MPIQVQTPDGNIAQFPDGMSDAAIQAVLAKEYPAPKAAPVKPPVNTYADVIRSLPGGLAKGVSAIAGLPGDINSLIAAGGDKLLSATGLASDADIAKMQQVRAGLPVISAPTSQQVADTIAKPFGGYYKPQTVPGQYAETIASFAPAAVAPGGLIARLARVAIPATTSETAGQLTKGTDLEPYARVIGALAGGAVTGLGELSASAARPTPGVPTVAELKNAAHGAYGTAENAGVVISKDSFQNSVDDLKSKLADAGIDQTLHPKAIAALSRLQGVGDNITLKGVDILRRVASGAAGSIDKDERRIARMIVDHIDDYVGNLKPTDIVQGDAQGATEALGQARDFWTRASKGEILDNAIQKAGTRASQFSGSGYENALRTQFRQLAMNDRVMRRFTPSEQDAIKQVAMGGPVVNSLRFLGKFSPHGLMGTLLTGGAGFAAGGPAGAVAALAAGEAGRMGATAMTTRSARLASELVRKGNARSISQASLGKAPPIDIQPPQNGASVADRLRQLATPPSQ